MLVFVSMQMEKQQDEVIAGQVISKWRTVVGHQSSKIATFADNVVLPKNVRISRRTPKTELIDMNTVESQHPQSNDITDEEITTSKTEHFPAFMVGVSLIQIFVYYAIDTNELTMKFGYDPRRRHEVWRFFTPMFVHANWSHLWGNLVMQLILGVFLEIVHEWKRSATIYLISVLGGTLCITILDNTSYSVGASGAVMGLLFSQLSTIILNWNEMERKFSRFFCVGLYIAYDVGRNAYMEIHLNQRLNISHAAHFGGSVTGFLVSILVLKNFKSHPWERILQNVCIVVLIMIFAIIVVINATVPGYFPKSELNFDYEKSYYGKY